MKKKINGVVVVEGKSDTQKLQQYYDVVTFETSGMGLNVEMLDVLENLALRQQIIILTDPDVPGEQIRKKIMERIPNALHVMLSKEDAISANKKKLGVEHASYEALEKAFDNIHQMNIVAESDVVLYNQSDMVYYGFIGGADAKKRRDYIATRLHLGIVNGKQFLKRLNLFMISRIELEDLLAQYLAEVGDGTNDV